MAQIHPFAALRYNPAKVQLQDVLTQPYDKITPEMQERYYAADPHNLVRIELGKAEPGDTPTNGVYSRAASFLKTWRDEGVLEADKEPSIYAYSQFFAVPPGSGLPAGAQMERRGFIALGKIYDYTEKVVFRHEQTLAKPKADRLNLLRATTAHSGQIFMLYSDPQGDIDALVWTETEDVEPTVLIKDEYGVTHRLWKISNHETIIAVRDKMADKKLIIADGHHRYETALAYRNERRADEIGRLMTLGRTAGIALDANAPYENLMMTFVNMEGEGLLILPTHRVVFGLNSPDLTTNLLHKTKDLFFHHKLPKSTSAESLSEMLTESAKGATVFVAVTQEGSYLLRANPVAIDKELESLSPAQRKLDVVQLHKVILEKILGISEEAIRNQTNINYVRSAAEAVQRVRDGADAAFLMNPVQIDQMSTVAFADEVMPQKSTDFYPKLLSGLTIYAME
ncbi:MAG: hypothetical protein JWO13_3395 [Acidobacteriales bacterium]|nr:hypothetical protein [Terriglobales bacterium]